MVPALPRCHPRRALARRQNGRIDIDRRHLLARTPLQVANQRRVRQAQAAQGQALLAHRRPALSNQKMSPGFHPGNIASSMSLVRSPGIGGRARSTIPILLFLKGHGSSVRMSGCPPCPPPLRGGEADGQTGTPCPLFVSAGKPCNFNIVRRVRFLSVRFSQISLSAVVSAVFPDIHFGLGRRISWSWMTMSFFAAS